MMTLEEAANVILSWLRGKKDATFHSTVAGFELGPESFRVHVMQVAPVQRRRVFEVAPLDRADCYEVKEVEAA